MIHVECPICDGPALLEEDGGLDCHDCAVRLELAPDVAEPLPLAA